MVRGYPVEEFLWGLAAGAVALVVAAVLARARRVGDSPPENGRHDERPFWSRAIPTLKGPPCEPVTGLLMTAAALGAISRTWSAGGEVLVGLCGVAVAMVGFTRWRSAGPVSVAFAVLVVTPSAYLLAADSSSIGWVRGLVVVSVVVSALAASRTDAGWGATGLPPVLYAVTAAGVFAAVPDTEEAAALLGASVPAALAGWPLGRARLGPAGAATATALLVWVAAVGGRGRPASIVGAVACLGLLVTLPVGRWLAHSRGWSVAAGRPEPPTVTLLAAHTAVVAVASRVAGVSAELTVAAPVAAATVATAVAASAVAGRVPVAG